MQGILRTTSMMLVFAFMAVACDPGEDQIGDWDDNDTISVETTRAELQQVRTDVDSILNELRSELEAMRAEVREDRVDDWNRVASDVEDTRGDLMEDLREADGTDRGEAERIRNNASERIAELEADVARSEIELTANAEALTRRVDQHLSRLESDIEQLSSLVAEYRRADQMRDTARVTDRDRADVRTTRSDWLDLDDDDIRDFSERLAEARREAQQIPRAATDDDLEDVRDDLADKVADLTRDVREHVHLMKWTERGHTRTDMRQQDTEYE